jgi:hypothetical protein
MNESKAMTDDIIWRLRERIGVPGRFGYSPDCQLLADAAAEIERLRSPVGKPVSEAPRDGEQQAFEIKFNARAFWDAESKRWILSYPLNMEYLPSHSRYLGPVTFPPAPHPAEKTGGGE